MKGWRRPVDSSSTADNWEIACGEYRVRQNLWRRKAGARTLETLQAAGRDNETHHRPELSFATVYPRTGR